MKFSMTGQEKGDLFNTSDCLIEVTTWAGLTVLDTYIEWNSTGECRSSLKPSSPMVSLQVPNLNISAILWLYPYSQISSILTIHVVPEVYTLGCCWVEQLTAELSPVVWSSWVGCLNKYVLSYKQNIALNLSISIQKSVS